MSLIAVETWHHANQIIDAYGEKSYDISLTTVKDNLDEAIAFCIANPNYAGKPNEYGRWSWHWRITEYKADCKHEEEQTFYNNDAGSSGGSLHVLPSGDYCNHGGVEIDGTLLWSDKEERAWSKDDHEKIVDIKEVVKELQQNILKFRTQSFQDTCGEDMLTEIEEIIHTLEYMLETLT